MQNTYVISSVNFNHNGQSIFLEFHGTMFDALTKMRSKFPGARPVQCETETTLKPLQYGYSAFTGEPVLTIKTPETMERKNLNIVVLFSMFMALLLISLLVWLSVKYDFLYWLTGSIGGLFVLTVLFMIGAKGRKG